MAIMYAHAADTTGLPGDALFFYLTMQIFLGILTQMYAFARSCLAGSQTIIPVSWTG